MHLVNLFQFRTAVATIALSIGLIGAQSDAAIPKIVQDASVKVQSSVAHFQQSHSLADLQTAINTMYGTIQQHTLTPANFVETRRTLARSWATILKAIETAYDPTYNPSDRNNVPYLCVPPPDVAGAAPCMAPDKISDSKIRAQYVAEIKENNRKKQRLEHYLRVKHLDDEAMSTLDMSLELFNDIAPSDVGPDGTALESIFRSASISARRLNQLHDMIYAHAASTHA